MAEPTAAETYVKYVIFRTMRESHRIGGSAAEDLCDRLIKSLFEDPTVVSTILELIQEKTQEETHEWMQAQLALHVQASQFVRRVRLLGSDISLPHTLLSEFLALEEKTKGIDELMP